MSGDLLRVEEAQATSSRASRRSRTRRPSVRGPRSAGCSRRRSRRPCRCRRGTTPRWTGTRSGRLTWRRRGSGRPCGSRWSGSRARDTPPTPACSPGPPSGSPPGPRCRPAPTPWCRSSSRRHSTRAVASVRAGVTPQGRCRPRASSTSAVAVGNAVRTMGGDVREGTEIARPGDLVTPAVVALAAGAGVAQLIVRRRPIVAVLATGDEVRASGTDLGPAGIPDANGPGLQALVRDAGAEPLDLGIAVGPARGRRGAPPARTRRGGHRRGVGRGVGRPVRRRAHGVRRGRAHRTCGAWPSSRASRSRSVAPTSRERRTRCCCSACRATRCRAS